VPTLPIHAVIELAFDPVAQVGDWHVRLQTIGLAVVILLTLLVAARVARRTPRHVDHDPDAVDPKGEPNHLRRDDLLYIAVAALPGAVVGGRIGYALTHLPYYSANTGAIFDVGQGGYELSLAVVGGTITSAAVATLLDAPIQRWMHALILPLLFGLAAGKLTMVLGGDGQGVPWDGVWATAYLGPGPWLSLAPDVPSHPSQVYEALATLGVIAIMAIVLAAGLFPRRGAGAYLFGIALWAVARMAVAFTWRDPAVLGPLSADQVLAIVIATGALALLAVVTMRDESPVSGPAGPSSPRFSPDPELDWPDPAARPRI
jgi:prolipoprotein diacylglyceryltransferase